jgi:hypothetical protein
MTRYSLLQRLAALEQRSCGDTGAYIVDIGDEDGQVLTLDEWQRRWPNPTTVDIGSTLPPEATNV